jgi:hypothetical protein
MFLNAILFCRLKILPIKITIVLYVHDSSLGANWTTILFEEFAVGM